MHTQVSVRNKNQEASSAQGQQVINYRGLHFAAISPWFLPAFVPPWQIHLSSTALFKALFAKIKDRGETRGSSSCGGTDVFLRWASKVLYKLKAKAEGHHPSSLPRFRRCSSLPLRLCLSVSLFVSPSFVSSHAWQESLWQRAFCSANTACCAFVSIDHCALAAAAENKKKTRQAQNRFRGEGGGSHPDSLHPEIKTNTCTVSSYGEAHIKNPDNIPVFTINNESFWITSRESRLEAGELCGADRPAGLTVDSKRAAVVTSRETVRSPNLMSEQSLLFYTNTQLLSVEVSL